MNNRKNIHVGSKWAKTAVLLRDRSLKRCVPETRRMNPNALSEMLRLHKMVYIKPVSGTFGKGVMKIVLHPKKPSPAYTLMYEKLKIRFSAFEPLYAHISRVQRKRPYLIQKGIRLLTHEGKWFDIRVMVQKNAKNEWETTGIIGRVAHPGKIVTNYHSGGKPMDVRVLMKPYVKDEAHYAAFERNLREIGRSVAAALNRQYPGLNMIGADIGVEADLTPWIIEVNTSPDPYIFRHLPDKSVVRKVLRYARALGRIPPARPKAKT